MQPTKKNIFYWTLYDFAKAIVVITFTLYFSQWLVVENKVADIWYNLIFVGASILLLLTGPVLARAADKKNQAMPYLRWMAVLMFISTLTAGLLAVLDNKIYIAVPLAAVCFLFSNYFYQFSLIFYNGFLSQLAPADKQGLVSGIGYAGNWMGQFAGVLIALPFATGALYLFGHSGRAQTFVPATLIFFVLALPMLLFFKEAGAPKNSVVNLKNEFKNSINSFIEVCKLPGVGRFLLGFFLFNDAIITLENNFAIYLQQVFHVSDKLKSLFLLAVLIGITLGSFFGGMIADKLGLKKSLMAILTALIIFVFAAGIANSFSLFFISTFGIGLFYGACVTVSRAMLAKLAPTEKTNHAFSYYSLVERFATLVGPVAWGLTILFLTKEGVIGYKTAWLLMTIFILAGAMVIRKIPSDAA